MDRATSGGHAEVELTTSLPLPGSTGRLRHPIRDDHVDLVLDYENVKVLPCTPRNVAILLSRVRRYGVHLPPQQADKISVLRHSVLVAKIARHLSDAGCDHEYAYSDVVSLYAALHDVGEIFGGDPVAMMAKSAVGPLKELQGLARNHIVEAFGLPLLPVPSAISHLVRLADLCAVPVEKVAVGLSPSFRAAVDEAHVVSGFADAVDDSASKVGLMGESALSMVEAMSREGVFGATPRVPVIQWINALSPSVVLARSVNSAGFHVAEAPSRLRVDQAGAQSFLDELVVLCGGGPVDLHFPFDIKQEGKATVVRRDS